MVRDMQMRGTAQALTNRLYLATFAPRRDGAEATTGGVSPSFNLALRDLADIAVPFAAADALAEGFPSACVRACAYDHVHVCECVSNNCKVRLYRRGSVQACNGSDDE